MVAPMQQRTPPMHAGSDASHWDSRATADELRCAFDPSTPLFVLIDPMAGEPLPGIEAVPGGEPQPQREAAWGREVTRIALHERVPLLPHQHPYLIGLRGLDDPLLDITLELAHAQGTAARAEGLDGTGMAAHHIGGWMQSSMHPPQLAQALALMCRVNTDAWTEATYLRLPDPRTLDLLRHVAGDARVTGQFGRLQSWTYVDARGQLGALRAAGEETSLLYLGWQEWRIMDQGALLHRTLAQWLGEMARTGDGPSQHGKRRAQELYPALLLALANAKRAARRWPSRFNKLEDQTVWAALCLLHPGLAGSDAVRALMDEPGTADEPPEPVRYLHRELTALIDPTTASS